MSNMVPGSDEWLSQVTEEVVEPDLPIVDPHHHLWPAGGARRYGVDELLADTGSGHRVEQTVFIECRAAYDTEAPPELQPVGETEFVADAAVRTGGLISGIVAKADLRRDDLDVILDRHIDASKGLLRGVRDALARADQPEGMTIARFAPQGLAIDPNFQRGVRRLGARGLTYDSWHYHYQNSEFLELARAVPETILVLDHFGTPLGVGAYAGRRDEFFDQWKADIGAVAECENVVAKLGGLAMPDNGFGWHTAARPPTSDEFLAAQAPYFEHTIAVFGPDRCMFESNFPVDRASLSYVVVWNAFKKLTADYSPNERAALFSETARRVYSL